MASAKDVDDFLAAVPPDKRAALLKLRRTIRAAAPKAVELINYGVPMFRLDGQNLVSYAAATNHCSFYVQSPAVMRAFAADLKDYRVGKGSIQFAADKPIPAALVTKLVKARIAENGKGR
ncbi:MAG: iron chaperone [Candidatus Limnocylindria bacterium]